LGCGVILVQQVIAVIPWILYGDWLILMVTACGTIASLITGSLGQWRDEKWPGRRMRKAGKVVALTRGNGHPHVMVIVSEGIGWDLESMATASGSSRRDTRFIFSLLALWWTLLLVTVSGLKQNTWFLIAVGGIGMVQNIYVAGARRSAGAFNIHLEPWKDGPTIIGEVKRRHSQSNGGEKFEDAEMPDEDSLHENGELEVPYSRDLSGVMKALMVLETKCERAGASLLEIFFPGGLKYEPGRHLRKVEQQFWKHAFRRARLLEVPDRRKNVQMALPDIDADANLNK
jgi:hypothetical protein